MFIYFFCSMLLVAKKENRIVIPFLWYSKPRQALANSTYPITFYTLTETPTNTLQHLNFVYDCKNIFLYFYQIIRPGSKTGVNLLRVTIFWLFMTWKKTRFLKRQILQGWLILSKTNAQTNKSDKWLSMCNDRIIRKKKRILALILVIFSNLNNSVTLIITI